MLSDPKAMDKYGIEDNIDLKKYNMRVIPLNSVTHWGYLYYFHGIYINQYHAAKTALSYRKCIVYGHTHDMQEFMIHSPINEREKIAAKSIGCLCTMNPNYLKNKPSKWVNAFHIAYIRDDGTFNDYTIVITKGMFTAPNGKVYR